MNSPAPTSRSAAMARTLDGRQEAEPVRLPVQGASRTRKKTRAALPSRREPETRARRRGGRRCKPAKSAGSFRCRAQSRLRRPCNWPPPTPRSSRRRSRTKAVKTRQPAVEGRKGRTEAAERPPISSMPAVSGTTCRRPAAGHPGPGRRPQGPQGRQLRRSATDRQRYGKLQQGAGLRTGAASPVDRSNIVAASAPIPRSMRPTAQRRRCRHRSQQRRRQGPAEGTQGQGSVIATSTRLGAAKGNDVWMRVMMLAPSASTSMSATVLGDADMTPDARLFRQAAGDRDELLGRSDVGMATDRFTGSATARLATKSFVMRTASLR